MIKVGQRLEFRGMAGSHIGGLKVIDENKIANIISVRPIFSDISDKKFIFNRKQYKISTHTVGDLVDECPAWNLLVSVSLFPDQRTAAMASGIESEPVYLKENAEILCSQLQLRGRSNILANVNALGRPIIIKDSNGSKLIVTETIELNPVYGSNDIPGRIGSVFETDEGIPVGVLISRNQKFWYLAPLLPYLKWTNQQYTDPIITQKKNFSERLRSAPILDLEMA